MNMNLNELASACQLYNDKTNFDASYITFLNSINNNLNLNNHEHRKELLVWLNKWACRQFALNYHETSSTLIQNWYNEFNHLLPSKDRNIWELSEKDFNLILILYEKLKKLEASKRNVYSEKISISVGPTGSSKILFAIRPKSLIPWDGAMRDDFREGDSGFAYIEYIKKANELIRDLIIQCRNNNFEINELPKKINRPYSTIPKLIDEYNWVTITKGWTVPKIKNFKLIDK